MNTEVTENELGHDGDQVCYVQVMFVRLITLILTMNLSMETTRNPGAIEGPPKEQVYDPTVNLQWDGSTEEGSALRDPAFLEEFSSFCCVLSEVRIGPVIAWGDVARHWLCSKCFSQHYAA